MSNYQPELASLPDFWIINRIITIQHVSWRGVLSYPTLIHRYSHPLWLGSLQAMETLFLRWSPLTCGPCVALLTDGTRLPRLTAPTTHITPKSRKKRSPRTSRASPCRPLRSRTPPNPASAGDELLRPARRGAAHPSRAEHHRGKSKLKLLFYGPKWLSETSYKL